MAKVDERELLYSDAEFRWVQLPGHNIEVTADALKWGGVRYGVSAWLQQKLADKYGGFLPTPEISDLCAVYGTLLPVKTRTPDHTMDDVETMQAHSAWMDEQLDRLLNADDEYIISGWKDWVLSPKAILTRAVNYGWHTTAKGKFPAQHAKGYYVMQPEANRHSLYHSDYSQLCRLWRPLKEANCILIEVKRPFDRQPGVDRSFQAAKLPEPDPEPRRTDFAANDKHLPGTPVRDGQEFLNEMGFGPLAEDGIHGTLTERAWRAWAASDKPIDHDDVKAHRAKDEASSWRTSSMAVPVDFSQSRDFTHGRPDYAKCRGVIIHTAEMYEVFNAAERLAQWTASGRANVSWHYAIDNDSVTQSVLERDTAWACGPANDEFIHIELAGRASQTHFQWEDSFSEAMLKLAAPLVSDICRHYDVPIRLLTPDDLLDGKRGIAGHDSVSKASFMAKKEAIRGLPWWDPSRRVPRRTTNHYDPGKNFPWLKFLKMVKEA